MPTRAYDAYRNLPFIGNTRVLYYTSTWAHSPRVNGKLRLRDNPFNRYRTSTVSWKPANANSANLLPKDPPAFLAARFSDTMDKLKAETYAKLRGRLYKGSAALGVTMASWRQSQEMIVTRYRQMSLQSDSFEVRARRVLKTKRRGKPRELALDKLGSQYLEMVFGWQPLLTDVHAALSTVINSQPQTSRLSIKAAEYVSRETQRSPVAGAILREHITGVIRHTRGATVQIDNPNTWLRERAGLNNPAAIVWDLVPWSWVVNMFSNVGGLVNSLTDFAGLSFPSSSEVPSYDLKIVYTLSGVYGSTVASGYSVIGWTEKRQLPGGVGRPPLVFRLPGLDFGLAAIAASVFTQKFSKLNTLILTTKKLT